MQEVSPEPFLRHLLAEPTRGSTSHQMHLAVAASHRHNGVLPDTSTMETTFQVWVASSEREVEVRSREATIHFGVPIVLCANTFSLSSSSSTSGTVRAGS